MLAGLAGIAIADEQGMLSYEAADYSPSADPSWPAESSDPSPIDTSQTDASEIREPMETGSVPGMSGSSPDENCCSDSGDPTFRLGGP